MKKLYRCIDVKPDEFLSVDYFDYWEFSYLLFTYDCDSPKEFFEKYYKNSNPTYVDHNLHIIPEPEGDTVYLLIHHPDGSDRKLVLVLIPVTASSTESIPDITQIWMPDETPPQGKDMEFSNYDEYDEWSDADMAILRRIEEAKEEIYERDEDFPDLFGDGFEFPEDIGDEWD